MLINVAMFIFNSEFQNYVVMLSKISTETETPCQKNIIEEL